ncbi:transcriptional regulator with GAF, ATPase, and Fis domain [Bradyrhizobium sp. i1.3.1]
MFDSSAIEFLMSCEFPGNVRELENCVQRTATLAQGSSIVRHDFACCHGQCLSAKLWKCGPGEMARHTSPNFSLPARLSMPPPEAITAVQPVSSELTPLGPPERPAVGAAKLTDRERVIEAMERSGWVQAKAARLLGLTPRQIGYALRRHGIEIKRFLNKASGSLLSRARPTGIGEHGKRRLPALMHDADARLMPWLGYARR